MLKRVITVTMVCGLLLALLPAAGAYQASEGTTSTSILVQNLSANDATVTVDFYNTAGTNTGSKSTTEPLAGEASTTFDQRYDSGDPGTDPFQGAAIVSADQAIGAVVQEVRSGGSGAVNSYEAYNGWMSPGKSIKAPLVMRGIASAGKIFNTFMAIQNTSLTDAANVTVDFSPDPALGLGTADQQQQSIAAGGTWYIMQADQTGLGDMFFGSAVVSSTQDVAVVVNSGANDGSSLIAYPTYAAGSAEVYLPGAMKNILSIGDNYFTSLSVVNMGTDPVDVEVEYQPLSAAYTVGAAYTKRITTSATIDQRYDTAITSDQFMGAISVKVQGTGAIAAMLNTRGDDATTGAAKFASTYGGFATGVQTAFMPYLLKYVASAGYDWSTSILIQNLDPDAGALTVNISYTGIDLEGNDVTFTSSKDVTLFDFVDLRYDAQITSDKFYGGAKLTASRPFGAAVLVRGSFGTGDALSSYLGVSQ